VLDAPGITKQGCGRAIALTLERGHRYLVVVSWKYTDTVTMPGGVVRSDALSWWSV
jgi:hypothetical protein